MTAVQQDNIDHLIDGKIRYPIDIPAFRQEESDHHIDAIIGHPVVMPAVRRKENNHIIVYQDDAEMKNIVVELNNVLPGRHGQQIINKQM